MYTNKLLSRPPDAARALTDEFLPGQGLADAGTGLRLARFARGRIDVRHARRRRYGPRA